ncbi:MAG TPA: hypothetical protein VGC18_01920 [Lacisediminihabitans sp.]|uniref:hypothetical protein n=1 Tax=Lacisediminihabitans sp. TaxID=2787631 RepID=UPI002EDAB636
MPWWSWLLIWGLLVLAVIAMLVLFAVWLFRKLMSVFDALEELATKAEILERAAEPARDHYEIAALRPRSDVQAERESLRLRRDARREQRHRNRLDRARRITKLDASTRRWFTDE